MSPGLVFKRSGDATKETCPRSPHLTPFSSSPFDCLARAIGLGRIGTPTRRPEGPSVFNGNKWPTLWASGCLGNRKPGPMAQAMSMAGPLARNHMSRLGENASQRCLSGLNGKTQNDSRFNQDLQNACPTTRESARWNLSPELCLHDIEHFGKRRAADRITPASSGTRRRVPLCSQWQFNRLERLWRGIAREALDHGSRLDGSVCSARSTFSVVLPAVPTLSPEHTSSVCRRDA